MILTISTISVILMVGLIRDALSVSRRLEESISASYHRFLTLSGVNVWQSFLTTNAAFWDDICHPDISASATRTSIQLIGTLVYSERNVVQRIWTYTLNSTTVVHTASDKVISVELRLFEDNNEVRYGAVVDFGWPGI